MNVSNQFSVMDEDVLFYLSTLSHEQQKQLDDFISIDHAIVPSPVKFAYGNSIGANNYFGRPVSVYEPFHHGGNLEFIAENEFSSLPPDLVSSSNLNIDQTNYPWEAEDAEYIETLNELHDNFVEPPQVNFNQQTVAVDVHHFDPDETHIYATVNKPKKVENPMTTSDRSVSDPPREKFPKIMTQSCYGHLNNPTDLWNSFIYEQDLINSTENLEDPNAISSLLTDSSMIDGVSSMNSSMYEQIPSLTSSSIDMQRSGGGGPRKTIKWWDSELHEHAEEIVDLQEIAGEGESMFLNFLFFIMCSKKMQSEMQRDDSRVIFKDFYFSPRVFFSCKRSSEQNR